MTGYPTGAAPLPRYAHRRGTRGFAAVVTTLAGLVVLAVGAVVLILTGMDGEVGSWRILQKKV